MSALCRQPEGPAVSGRRFHPKPIIKLLVLQRFHGLADEATSFQITDHNSFRAFLGLNPKDAVPDGQTFSDFCALLIETKTFESLFDTFLTHLQKEHGLT